MTEQRIKSSAEAINEALALVGKANDNSILFGEGISDPSSFFGTTKDLVEIYGESRVYEMPISENALCGIAIGAAMQGKHSIISFHRVEFALLAMEQIVNNAAKMHYVSNGVHNCPLVIRLIVGRGWGQGPEHSQSLESMFSSVPGLKVMAPVFPNDYKGMMISAIEDKNPVIFIEHRWTHFVKGHVNDGYYLEDITEPKVIRKGDKCTVVSVSFSTIEALRASEVLSKLGIEIEVIDLRVLNPLNEKNIIKSVNKTGRLLTLDLGCKNYGIGSEIVSRISESCWSNLKMPPKRLGLPDHPLPSSRGYLPGLYLDAEKIVLSILELLGQESLKEKGSKIFKSEYKNEFLDIPHKSFQGPF